MKSARFKRLFMGWVVVSLVMVSLLQGQVGRAAAAALVVNTLADETDGSCTDGDCSLRDAVALASSGDTITFSVTGTITQTLDYIEIDQYISIIGPGPGALTLNGSAGKGGFSVDVEADGGDILISGLSFTNIDTAIGNHTMRKQKLTIDNCRFENNISSTDGGAIYSTTTLLVKNSTFLNNSAKYSGGAIYAFVVAPEIENSTFIGNTASGMDGGAVAAQGRLEKGTHLIVKNSRFSGNQADEQGGAVFVDNETLLTVHNSRFDHNRAADGGAIHYEYNALITGSSVYENTADPELDGDGYGGGIHSVGYEATTVTIQNTSIYKNTARFGGGLCGDYGSWSTVSVQNSSLLDNVPTNVDGSLGTYVKYENNILAYLDNGEHYMRYADFPSGSSNNLVTDLFGPAAAGFTDVGPESLALRWQPPVLAIGSGSLAIDAGSNSTCLATDQRGWVRPVDGDEDGDAVCDAGAYEFVPGMQAVYLPALSR